MHAFSAIAVQARYPQYPFRRHSRPIINRALRPADYYRDSPRESPEFRSFAPPPPLLFSFLFFSFQDASSADGSVKRPSISLQPVSLGPATTLSRARERRKTDGPGSDGFISRYSVKVMSAVIYHLSTVNLLVDS